MGTFRYARRGEWQNLRVVRTLLNRLQNVVDVGTGTGVWAM